MGRSHKGGRKRVLVADDERIILELFTAVVRLAGYEIDATTSGSRAVEAADDPNVALAIIDMRMPDVDGLEVFRRIRAKRPDLPVMMTTGFGVDESLRKALKMGAAGCLHKPFDVSWAIEEIKRLLNDTAAETV